MRASWLENYNHQFPLLNGFNQSTINANYGALQAEQVNAHQGILPGVGIQGYSVGAKLSQLYWVNTAYSLSRSLTKTLKRHTFRFGGSARQLEWTGFGNTEGVGMNALPSPPQAPLSLAREHASELPAWHTVQRSTRDSRVCVGVPI